MTYPELDAIDSTWLRRFRRALVTWYRANARPLPWRNIEDPYPIWISEIMLQQTTVAAVVPCFERFLRSFPSLVQLAAASEEDVLRHWEGLGYYSRARNIHRAAQILVAEHGGMFPDTVEALSGLPGIGRYTAGAIASFAFDLRAPIVEANTLRVYSRLLALRADPRSVPGQKVLWHFAERVLPKQSPGLFNQALMELGATVCSPEAPDCPRCPVRACCAAFATSAQAEIPIPAIRVAPTAVTEVAVAVRRKGQYLLRKRAAGERWAGLWDFLRFPETTGETPADANRKRRHATPRAAARPRRIREVAAANHGRLAEQINAQTGIHADVGERVAEMRHTVTRFRITLHCYRAEWRAGEIDASRPELRWVAPAEIADYPLSTTGRKFAKLLSRTGGTPLVVT